MTEPHTSYPTAKDPEHYWMKRGTKVTRYRVSQFHNPGVAVWHLASVPEFHICLYKDIDERRYYSSLYERGWIAAVSTCQEMAQALDIPSEKFFVWGSTTYDDEDLRDFIRIYETDYQSSPTKTNSSNNATDL